MTGDIEGAKTFSAIVVMSCIGAAFWIAVIAALWNWLT